MRPDPAPPEPSPDTSPLDRLGPVLDRFRVRASLFHAGALCGVTRFAAEPGRAFLHVLRQGELQVRQGRNDALRSVPAPALLFYPRAFEHVFVSPSVDGADLVCATLAFEGGDRHPVAASLPPVLILPITEIPGLGATLELLFDEADRARCGSRVVLDRLFDVVLVQLLRALLAEDAGATQRSGLMAGLAHPRLARLLSALHRAPGEDWPLERMAEVAGLSRSAFAGTFARVLGTTPAAYLSAWRIDLACHELRSGRPISVIADQLGFSGAAAFSRAFRERLGCTPREWRARAETV
ncbi:MAG: AraC family transcriptional regulator [Xanthomonadales bacterium]|jgi:AraC-like DNA-binding protein|nr:AraC family transcriptional regulator [Xanthomonadales bacterium]